MRQNRSKQVSKTPTCLFKFGHCIVYSNGDIDVIAPVNDFHYEISHLFLRRNNWIRHMSEKNWVNMYDFRRAFTAALALTENTILYDYYDKKAERPRAIYERP